MKSRDLDLEILIGRVLRIGVTASSVSLGVGLVLSILAPEAGGRLLHTGLIILLLTPTARVVLSIIEYTAAADWPFVALTTIVLLELVVGAIAAVVFNRRV
jgi:uncharacterized membrane protein